MAGLKEMAIGIATVLHSTDEPEPLPVQFRGETLENAAYLIEAVVRECTHAEIALDRVQVDEELLAFMRSNSADLPVRIGGGADPVEVRFWRHEERAR